jgi:hypothetical protein
VRLRDHRRHHDLDRRLLSHSGLGNRHDSAHKLLRIEGVGDNAERPAVELAREQDLLDEVGETV